MPPDFGYPDNDFNKMGPRPTTFSVEIFFSSSGVEWALCMELLNEGAYCMLQGQRALDFVLRNQGLIDKTLLFDIELLKIIPT